MIIVDRALAERARRNSPIRVGMIGAGFMARGIALQVATAAPGIRIAGIANRTVENARRAFREAGETRIVECSNARAVQSALRSGTAVVTSDPRLLAEADGIDVLLDVTGTIEPILPALLTAIERRKHVVLMNAELDGTLGPILKAKADDAGVIYTNVDGDQPGVTMNLYRFVTGIGVRPVLCGNIKGLHDPYRTPATQQAFAERWGQEPAMVTSFADGTKISFEQAIVANATGMRVARRGMHGFAVPAGTPIEDAARMFSTDELLSGRGIVDYVVGAVPAAGVFVLGTIEDPRQKHYLNLYKLGTGPIYCFYTPYHLCHFEVPATVARAALFADAALAPCGPPQVEVVAAAKRDLVAGETVDQIGGYTAYGLAENADIAAAQNLLPMGIAIGCRLIRDIKQDTVLTYADVELPRDRLCDRLREEQKRLWRSDSSSVIGEPERHRLHTAAAG